MRILVTGSAGFVGKETCRLLLREGHQVIPFDLAEDGLDIRNPDMLAWARYQYGPEAVLHLAAVARFADADADPLLALETNVIGTRNVAEAFADIPIAYASTGSVYMPISEEPPITEDFRTSGNSVYGCTKLMGELVLRQAAAQWMILRYAHLYGPEKRTHGLVGGFVERIERGLAPTLYGGRQSNDFTYIRDVARANVLALQASPKAWNQAYNIGTGEELSAETAGLMVAGAWGYRGEIELHRQREVDADRFVYDVRKAEQLLGFRAAYKFADGLRDMAPDPVDSQPLHSLDWPNPFERGSGQPDPERYR